MRLALDTNVLAYAEGVNGSAGKKAALAIIEKLPPTIHSCRSRYSANFSMFWCVKRAALVSERELQS